MKEDLRNIPGERTLVLIKPEAVACGLTRAIVERFEGEGFKIIACQTLIPTREQIMGHLPKSEEWIRVVGEKSLESWRESGLYPEEISGSCDPLFVGRKMMGWICDYLTSGRVVILVLKRTDAVATARRLIGHTLPYKAEPGTIRRDFYSGPLPFERACRNFVHGSGTDAEAEHEIANWFDPSELSEAEPAN